MSSRVESTTFYRQSDSSPDGVASLFYNDEAGVNAMSRGRFVDYADSVVPLAGGRITVSIVDATGTPLRVWHSHEALRGWYGIFEARIRRWNGLDLRDRWAHMGGQRVTRGDRRRPPYWVWNRGMHQLYM